MIFLTFAVLSLALELPIILGRDGLDFHRTGHESVLEHAHGNPPVVGVVQQPVPGHVAAVGSRNWYL